MVSYPRERAPFYSIALHSALLFQMKVTNSGRQFDEDVYRNKFSKYTLEVFLLFYISY